MTPKDSPVSIKNFAIVIGLLATLGGLGIFSSKADVKDTVEKVTCEKIAENDKLDTARFYGQIEGVELKTNVANLINKVDKNVLELEKINEKLDAQMKLLYRMNAKLDKDSL